MSPAAHPLLEAENVSRSFSAARRGLFGARRSFRAVDGVSLSVGRGETVGIVGESGCGKSTLARLLLGLTPTETGRIRFDGEDVTGLSPDAWRRLRTRMQVVFQDTGGALDPRIPVEAQVREALEIHGLPDAAGRADEVLGAVRLGDHLRDRYPHELSGGQLQRVIIARALALEPDLLVLDEPVSALDVSIQAQIINLLAELRAAYGLAYVFVSHDLGVIRHVADRVLVMYLGRVVEEAPKRSLFAAPRHPYSAALLAAAPVPDPARRGRRVLLEGEPPSPYAPPSGCRFHPRCPAATAVCAREVPDLRLLGEHRVACHHAETAVAVRKEVEPCAS